MEDNINIEKLFSDKLSNHESVVSDKVWSGIQSQMVGASATVATAKGISTTAKWIIGISSAVAISAVAVVLNFPESKNEIHNPKEIGLDSTEIIVQNKEVKIENKAEEVNKESYSKSTDFNIASTPKSAINNGQEIEYSENTTSISTDIDPKKLIVQEVVTVRQTIPEVMTQVKTEKPSTETQETSKQIAETSTSVVKNSLKGSVQEWKKTNVFSPNNDGINDLFFLDTKELKEFSITVINEKNEVVFISDDSKFKWDGTDYKTGEMVPAGSYGYIVFAVDVYNNPIKIFNSLNISR